MADILGIDRRKDKENKDYQNLKKGIIPSKYKHGKPIRVLQLEGKVPHKEKGVETGEYSKMYDRSQYQFMLDAPFEVSNRCCGVMKKEPAHRYSRETKRMPITAQMASESKLRTGQWVRYGCNMFDAKNPISNPMSFWTEQDVLRYIKDRNLPICSVYGEVVSDDEESGQMQMFDLENEKLHCTGCQRTGCVLCGFGAHIKGDDRFLQLKETHPGMYALLDKATNSGYTMRQAIEWVNQNSNKHIPI